MAVFLRRSIMGVTLGLLLFCMSCEKHPLGQMPDVQREQRDPAKVWSKGTKKDSEESSTSRTPAESSHEAH
jgi:hypothetical protein